MTDLGTNLGAIERTANEMHTRGLTHVIMRLAAIKPDGVFDTKYSLSPVIVVDGDTAQNLKKYFMDW